MQFQPEIQNAVSARNSARQGKAVLRGPLASTNTPTFLRLVRTGERWFELQTAVVSYKSSADEEGEERELDVIAMVHLADPLYYKELKEMTEAHDRVLYELIVDKEVVWEDSTGPLKQCTYSRPLHLVWIF